MAIDARVFRLMGIPSHQEIGLRPANPRLAPKFQTGHGEEQGLPSDFLAVQEPLCTNRRYVSRGFYLPAEHPDRAQETASAKYFERAREAKTSMQQVPSLEPRSDLAYWKSFSSVDLSSGLMRGVAPRANGASAYPRNQEPSASWTR